MTSSNDILTQIDNTLDDWTVSEDAMRSRPAAEAEPAREVLEFRGATPIVQIMDEVGEWLQAEGVASVEFCVGVPEAFEEAAEAWAQITERIRQTERERARRAQAALEAFIGAYAEAVKPAVEAAGEALAEMSRTMERAQAARNDRQPPPRRDRPAWQSPYGPAQRRRRS